MSQACLENSICCQPRSPHHEVRIPGGGSALIPVSFLYQGLVGRCSPLQRGRGFCTVSSCITSPPLYFASLKPVSLPLLISGMCLLHRLSGMYIYRAKNVRDPHCTSGMSLRREKGLYQSYIADHPQSKWGWHLGRLTQASDFFHHPLILA